MSTQPLWLDAKEPPGQSLVGPGRFDVVIVGGGITGLTAALRLKQVGKTVCVLEKGSLAHGETGHTSAHLSASIDLKVSEIVSNFGEKPARLVWHAGVTAIDFIESQIHELDIACDFQRVPGILHAAWNGKGDEAATLRKESEQCQALGIDAHFQAALPKLGRPGVMFADQARFHPVKYVQRLAQAVQGDGCLVCVNSEVSEIEDRPLRVKANGHALDCGHVILATHVPLMGKAGFVSATLFQSKLYPYSTYVVEGTIPSGVIPDALYWDTSDPYYYLRLIPGKNQDRVIFGGMDHKTGQVSDTDKQYAQLEATLLQAFPQIKLERRWSGQVIETNDGLPYIGPTAERQFAATGFSGNGLTFGTLAGLMACDYVLGRKNPWEKLFAVDRNNVRAGAWEYFTENVDYPYYMVKQWLTEGSRETPESLQPGEGKVLMVHGKRAACARDEAGQLHEVSAVCTHMGCLVRWNNGEKTWDCPCHGSRFNLDGTVIGGPAETPLEDLSMQLSK